MSNEEPRRWCARSESPWQARPARQTMKRTPGSSASRRISSSGSISATTSHDILGRGATGGHLAAPIVKEFLKVALADKPAAPFRVPPGIKLVRVDLKSGTRAGPGTERAILEAFKPGTAPPDGYSVVGDAPPDGQRPPARGDDPGALVLVRMRSVRFALVQAGSTERTKRAALNNSEKAPAFRPGLFLSCGSRCFHVDVAFGEGCQLRIRQLFLPRGSLAARWHSRAGRVVLPTRSRCHSA